MACFLVPMGVAIGTSVAQKAVEKREKKVGKEKVEKGGLSWSRRLSWLNKLLWGGVILLAIEHIWHGEVVPWPPFLTAMENPANIPVMLHEMATVGGAMTGAVTAVWAIMVMIAERREKAIAQERKAEELPSRA